LHQARGPADMKCISCILVLILPIVCIFTVVNGTVQYAQQLNTEITNLNSVLLYDDLYPPVLPIMLNVLDLLYQPPTGTFPKVLQNEFFNYVEQTQLPVLISRLNRLLKNLATQPWKHIVEENNLLRIQAFGIMAQIYFREYHWFNDRADYVAFVQASVPGEYDWSFNDIDATDDTAEDPLVTIYDDLTVHLWHLQNAVNFLNKLQYMSQVDTVVNSDAYKLASNVIFTVNAVLYGGTRDTSVNDYYLTYRCGGIEQQLHNFCDLKDQFPTELASDHMQSYARSVLQKQFRLESVTIEDWYDVRMLLESDYWSMRVLTRGATDMVM